MGKILGLNTLGANKVVVKLELTNEEALWLKGNMEKVHMFSEENLNISTRLVQRGKRESTKYFLLPRELRKDVGSSQEVLCNKIVTKTKDIFIFEVKKYKDE